MVRERYMAPKTRNLRVFLRDLLFIEIRDGKCWKGDSEIWVCTVHYFLTRPAFRFDKCDLIQSEIHEIQLIHWPMPIKNGCEVGWRRDKTQGDNRDRSTAATTAGRAGRLVSAVGRFQRKQPAGSESLGFKVG